MSQLTKLKKYCIRRKRLALAGPTTYILDPKGSLAAFSQHKSSAGWKQTIAVYSDESKRETLFLICQKNNVGPDFSYDVMDASGENVLGTVTKKGVKSAVQTTLEVEYNGDTYLIKEDSALLAFLRRYNSPIALIPPKYKLLKGNKILGIYKKRFYPFQYRLEVQLNKQGDAAWSYVTLAVGILLAATAAQGPKR
ncbi:MAG: hypothetical protein Q4C96_07160 [Planctomycetia bacterium]|nr:hypothetical protein [Planctomycetia bacterium]